jgi:hypothetical protein
MNSVQPEQSPREDRLAVADGLTEDSRWRTERILQVSRGWLAHGAVDAKQRESLIRLGVLADYMINTGDFSPSAMQTALTLMCANCLCLDATRGMCLGRPQDRCQLLEESKP